MRALPVKPEYGPTLGRLLSPRWRRLSARARLAAVLVAAIVVAAILAAVLTLLNSTLSVGGALPFSLSYRGLWRGTPPPGALAYLQRPRRGPARESLTVYPVHLPPYQGDVSGALPLFAAAYVRAESRTLADYQPMGESKTRVNSVPAYAVSYTATIGGRTYLGRDILVLPPRPGARDGVALALRALPSKAVSSASLVGGSGTLLLPLRSFSFG